MDDLDADQVDAEVAARAEADQRAAEADQRAAIAAHPHNQLKGILSDLQSPVANQADVNTRLAYLHSAVRRLIQVVLTHTPPPEEPHEG